MDWITFIIALLLGQLGFGQISSSDSTGAESSAIVMTWPNEPPYILERDDEPSYLLIFNDGTIEVGP